MSIHGTALVGPEVELADDVTVGPYVILEGPVKVGRGCRIDAHAVITGDTSLGERNVVGPHAVIGAFPQDLAYDPSTPTRVEIGSDNTIREFSTIHRGTAPGTATTLGDKNFLMAGAHVGHNCHVGNHCILANNVLLGGHVQVADRVFLGGGSVFHQFVRIGTLAIAQGLSGFSKDVPPYTVGVRRNEVIGLNYIGLRRAGLTPPQRQELKRAFQLVYLEGYNVKQALEQAGSESWGAEASAFFEFISTASKKGISALHRTRGPATEEPGTGLA